MRFHGPFCQVTLLASAVATFALLTEVSMWPARAQAAQAAQPNSMAQPNGTAQPTSTAQPANAAQPTNAAQPATNPADASTDSEKPPALPAPGPARSGEVLNAHSQLPSSR